MENQLLTTQPDGSTRRLPKGSELPLMFPPGSASTRPGGVDSYPYGVALCDINQDGWLDVVAGRYNLGGWSSGHTPYYYFHSEG